MKQQRQPKGDHAAALSLAFVVHLLILLANPDIHLAGEQWVRLALYFVLSCLFPVNSSETWS